MPSPISFESLWYFPMITFLYLVLKILIISPWSLRWEANFLFLFFCYCRNNCEWSHTISLFVFFFPPDPIYGLWWKYLQQQCMLEVFSDIMLHAKDNATNSQVLSSSWCHNGVFNRRFYQSTRPAASGWWYIRYDQ